jgi:multidrug efflux pump subunit AcrB
MTISKQKAKRKLFNFDFDTHGAHVALVSKDQGNAANGYKLIATKATNTGIQPTDVVKVQKALEQITVTMSMEEFLRKWFGMWYDDAELLTKLLGYETEYEAYQREEAAKMQDGMEVWSHSKWLEERISQFTIMKSLSENPNQTISDEDFIAITTLQSQIEKSLQQQNEEDPLKIQVEKARYEQLEQVEQAHEAAVAEATQLKVEKSALEVEVAELRTQVQKAKEEQEAVEFAAFEASLKDLVSAEELTAVAKSLFVMKATSPEAADVVIKSLQSKKELVEKSDLFQETTTGDEVSPEQIKKAAFAAELNKPY